MARTERAPRDPDRDVVRLDRARGGISPWSIVTGVVVALGAFVVLSAIVGAILAALGIAEEGISADEVIDASVGAGTAVVIVQLVSYLWGGYTAGRMARGSGLANGILVPIAAIVLVMILGAIVATIGDVATDVDPSRVQRLPLPLGTLSDIATGVGIALLVAMLLGGALGGMLGARWHTRLEKRQNSSAGTRRPGR